MLQCISDAQRFASILMRCGSLHLVEIVALSLNLIAHPPEIRCLLKASKAIDQWRFTNVF
jgi:hypothetical protein